MNENTVKILRGYLGTLVGVVVALVAAVMASTGIASPLDFGLGEWLTVANGIWAAAIPTVIRYFDSKDPAFGKIAESVLKEISDKLAEAEKAAKAAERAAKKAEARKATPKTASTKTTTKKS